MLDQFPHHIHRGRAEAFSTHARALELSLAAIDTGEDEDLAPIERVFLYLPIEHAESTGMQALSVALFERLVEESASDDRAVFADFLRYARAHRDVVSRFGRFPHRNEALGRASTVEETEFLRQPGSRF